MTFSRILTTLAASVAVALPTLAAAADIAFVGPSGWSHTGQPAPDPTHKFDQWKFGGGGGFPAQTVTFMSDSTGSYADSLALIRKNFADNHIKTSLDADKQCQGKQGHVVEFTVGPEGKEIVITRILVPADPGVVTITYARGKEDGFDDDVKKSIDSYCKAS